MHYWGDEWPYWNELYEAQNFICRRVYRRSLCRVMMKEKYGTLRYEWVFPPGGSLRISGIKLPKVFNRTVRFYDMEYKVPRYLFRWDACWIYRVWCRFGRWTLRRAVDAAVDKYPFCAVEILDDLVSSELDTGWGKARNKQLAEWGAGWE